jgi:arylsulfatase A-like enzyme
MPTLMDLAFDGQMSNVDGKSFEKVIKGDEKWDDRTVFWHEKKSRPNSTGDIPCTVMRSGNYKLMHFFEKDVYELYDLSNDKSEEKNIVNELPTVATKMKAELAAWKAKYLVASKINLKKEGSKVGNEDMPASDPKTETAEDPKADKKAAKKAAKQAEKKAARNAEKGKGIE